MGYPGSINTLRGPYSPLLFLIPIVRVALPTSPSALPVLLVSSLYMQSP